MPRQYKQIHFVLGKIRNIKMLTLIQTVVYQCCIHRSYPSLHTVIQMVSFGSATKVPCRMCHYQFIINLHKLFYAIGLIAFISVLSRLLGLLKKCIIIIYILCIDCADNRYRDNWPPNNWPPGNWPPDNWPPDNWPPDNWPPTTLVLHIVNDPCDFQVTWF